MNSTSIGNSTAVFPSSWTPLSFSSSPQSMTNALRTVSCISLMDSLVRVSIPRDDHSNATNLQLLAQKALRAAHSQFIDNCTNGSKPCDESPLETLCGKQTFQDETRRKFFMQLLLNRHFEPAEKIASQLKKLEKDAAFYLLAIEAGDAGKFDLAEQFKQKRKSGDVSKVTSFLGISNESSFARVFQFADQGNFAAAINELGQIPEEMNRKILTHAIRGAVTRQIQQLLTSNQREKVNAILKQIPSQILNKFRAYWNHLGLRV